MHPVADRALATMRRYQLVPRGARVLAAVSGGSDSVALAHILIDLREPAGFELVALLHFNHGLRGEAANEDEGFCVELARSLGVGCHVGAADVPRLMRERHCSLEVAARDARHQYFREAAADLKADLIALGHTRDDQAETLLLRLFRGAGARGLAGIHPRRGRVIRPLIELGREELRGYLAERDAAFREDSSNTDLSIPRNRIRHEVLPFLRRQISPGIDRVLAREAQLAREDADFIDQASRGAAERVVSTLGQVRTVDVSRLTAHPPAIARRILLEALRQGAGDRFVGADHVLALLDLAADTTGEPHTVDLPGQRAERIAGHVVLTPRKGRGAANQGRWSESHVALSIPGSVVIPPTGATISAEPVARPEEGWATLIESLQGRRDLVAIDGDRLAALEVRTWRKGDTFHPMGLGGRKKLQDFFVDRKVPRVDRAAVPLVVDDRGQIVWVAGHMLAEDFRVTAGTKAVVILRLESGGG